MLGTIVGACLGLGITHIPSIFSQPVLLLACLAAACVPLSMLATAQTRTGVALAVLTLLAVALCSYELACCVPGAHLMNAMTVFAARLGSVSAAACCCQGCFRIRAIGALLCWNEGVGLKDWGGWRCHCSSSISGLWICKLMRLCPCCCCCCFYM